MAKKATRIKNEAAAVRIPQNRDECVEYIADIGRKQRERDRIQTLMNDEMAVIKQKFEEQAKPIADDLRELSQGVQIWCEANRAALTNGGKVKFAHLASGEIKWRMRPPSVRVRGAETVIEVLKKLGLTRFVRMKEEINKDAILAEPEAAANIPGITITQAEDFVIIPFETHLEEVAA
jgi:phage host-nuclease inhibitor protein Gam